MFKLKPGYDLTSYTLIVPCASVGNVGQLAADVVISSLGMTKVGSIWHPALMPVVGSDPYDLASTALMVSCELYANTSKKIAVLQLRSPLARKYADEFLTAIGKLGIQYSFRRIVILSSSFASERHSINTVPFRYLSNPFVEDVDSVKKINWIDYNADGQGNEIHGGGFAKKLFETLTRVKLPCVVLFKYCSEGDNTPDATDMLDYLNSWMNMFGRPEDSDAVRYIIPPSWKLLFGNPPPREIY